MKALGIDNGAGCVMPTHGDAFGLARTRPSPARSSSMSRRRPLTRPEVTAFMQYILDNETAIAEAAQFVPLTEEQLAKAKTDLETALGS